MREQSLRKIGGESTKVVVQAKALIRRRASSYAITCHHAGSPQFMKMETASTSSGLGPSSEREKEPAWKGASNMPVPKRARAKKHHGEDGVIKAGLACINCKEAKKKCERAGMTSERWYGRKKSFQGYRKDRRNSDASLLDPITLHREEILSQLSPEERSIMSTSTRPRLPRQAKITATYQGEDDLYDTAVSAKIILYRQVNTFNDEKYPFKPFSALDGSIVFELKVEHRTLQKLLYQPNRAVRKTKVQFLPRGTLSFGLVAQKVIPAGTCIVETCSSSSSDPIKNPLPSVILFETLSYLILGGFRFDNHCCDGNGQMGLVARPIGGKKNGAAICALVDIQKGEEITVIQER
ncbi:hypothetical protein PENSPDRAFT_672343 [Peniophora sp. CONT]|nr:hypothetical protein PENSPDRAFT_672343 [Peniophora sp. CONT]